MVSAIRLESLLYSPSVWGATKWGFFTVPCVISSLCKGTNLMLFHDTVMLFEEQAQKSEDLATVPESLA